MVLELLSIELTAVLIVIALFAGIGISTVGPGGIFVTIALFLFLPITSTEVAGTASATFIATGLLATILYQRSGEFSEGLSPEITIILSSMSVIGAFAGSQVNQFIPDRTFGSLLAVFVALIGGLIVYREVVGLQTSNYFEGIAKRKRRILLGSVGFGVSLISGMLGVGGPVIAVPILVMLGVPILISVAVAQVQSVFISSFATAGYLAVDAVSIPLAFLIGIPQLVGVVLGWRIAHLVEAGRLRILLGIVLLLTTPIIVM